MTASEQAQDRVPVKGTRIAGKYRIEREIGRGGMGIVFEASHLVTGKHFAVKWLLPELAASSSALERFVSEARVAGRVTHPNLVEIYDIGEESGSSYMVMELLEGESLHDRLLSRERLSVDETCTILLPCLRGLAKAHAAGVIHRDLKPANIFLCRATPERDELPKLVDFGIAKLTASPGEAASPTTQVGALIGTPNYMAPEQVRGLAVDVRTDVYAVGIVLYEVLTGRLPFRAKTTADLVLQVLTETPIPVRELASDVPVPLSAAIERAMSRSPAERFQTIAELARELEPFANGLRFDTRSGVPAPPALQARSLRVPAMTIAGALGVALAAWFGLRVLAGPVHDPGPRGSAGQAATVLAGQPAAETAGSAARVDPPDPRDRVRELLAAAQLRSAPDACLFAPATDLQTAIERAQAITESGDSTKLLVRAARVERDPEILVWAADKLRDAGSIAAGRSAASTAIQHCPAYAQAHATLGTVEYQAKRYEPAARAFEAALRLDAGHDAARFNLALTLMQRGQGPAAVAVLDDLERRHPDYPRLHSARAQAHWIEGALEAAAHDAMLAIQREPDNARAHELLEMIRTSKH